MAAITIPWKKAFEVGEPQINADGMHTYPFDPSFPIDVRFFTMGGCKSIRLNRHHYLELYCISSGRTTVQVQGRFFEAGEGDMVVIGGGPYHRSIDLSNSRLRLTLLFFGPELLCATDGRGEEMEYLMPFLVQGPDLPHVIPGSTGIPAEVAGLMHRIHKELPATTARARLTVKTYLKMILVLLLNYYWAYLGTREDLNRKQADLERLQPLFNYLEDHYNLPILVDDAARLCAMSNSHFMYFFKRVTGQSFVSYVNHFRIAKARFLLTSTDKPLASISQEVAFCNQSYFGKVFRKLVGLTPLAYRRKMGKLSSIGHMPAGCVPFETPPSPSCGGRNLLPGGATLSMSGPMIIR